MKKFIISTILMLSLVASLAIAQYGSSPFGPVPPSNIAYNATTWNESYLAATQNALRDQLELMIAAYAPVGATYITQTANATLTAEQAMSLLDTGAVWNTTATGMQSIAIELTAIENLVSAADRGIQFTGPGAAGMFTLTAYAKTFLDDANEAAFKATVNLEAGVDYVAYDGALGTPTSGVATNLTGLPLTTGVTGVLPMANGGTGSSSAGAILGDGTAGRILRSVRVWVSDGTNAATIKPQVRGTDQGAWNGDTVAEEDNLAAGGDTGNFSLAASGSILYVDPAAVSGSCIGGLACGFTYNASGTDLNCDVIPDSGGYRVVFNNATTGANVNLTTLVDTGVVYVNILYMTDG